MIRRRARVLCLASLLGPALTPAGDEWQSPQLLPNTAQLSNDPPYQLVGTELRQGGCVAWVVAAEPQVHRQRTVNVIVRRVLAEVGKQVPAGCDNLRIHFYRAAHEKPSNPSFRITEQLGTYDRATNRITFDGDNEHYGRWVEGPAPAAAATTPQPPDDKPWAFNAPRGEGYRIDLLSALPAPGTPLRAGSEVDFKVDVDYSMSVAKTGRIVLVFQVDGTGQIERELPQVSIDVTNESGSTNLGEKITIPAGAGQLWLYVPLVPDGMKSTQGQIIIRYPITP